MATLAQPLLMEAHKGVAERCDKYALCVHDWSMVNFGKHQSKLDRKQRTHKNDIGYELQTALLLNDRNGEPFAPIVQNVVTDAGVLCCVIKWVLKWSLTVEKLSWGRLRTV
ncbi:hypothetical protein [Thioflexithrix psekupsensis]|uniref:hypothetical protein n=1 Tax=Thioflexithrix psekupsensis TaxID=1570016 RepID=UPI00111FF4D5|nr:hypothetical protein [Thioflexithrix psekupsensis]